MAVWALTLIAIGSYVTGFLLSGILFSLMFSDKHSHPVEDIVTSMFLWPVMVPGYLTYRGILGYVRTLESARSRRRGISRY